MSSIYVLATFVMSLVTGVFGNNGDSLRDEPPRIKADSYDVNRYVITTRKSVLASAEIEAKAREFKKRWELYRHKRQKHPEESPTTKAIITTTESESAEDATPFESEYAKEQREYKNAKELFRQRRQKHRGFVTQCHSDKYVKIKDDLGCELCTCIYEKSMMFCSRHECPTDSEVSLRQQISQDLYYDYVLHVDTNFREYKCTAGEVLFLSSLCDCKCVAPDVLSCPRNCNFGKKLY